MKQLTLLFLLAWATLPIFAQTKSNDFLISFKNGTIKAKQYTSLVGSIQECFPDYRIDSVFIRAIKDRHYLLIKAYSKNLKVSATGFITLKKERNNFVIIHAKVNNPLTGGGWCIHSDCVGESSNYCEPEGNIHYDQEAGGLTIDNCLCPNPGGSCNKVVWGASYVNMVIEKADNLLRKKN